MKIVSMQFKSIIYFLFTLTLVVSQNKNSLSQTCTLTTTNTYTWNGTTTEWANANNWTGAAGYPQSGDGVIIGSCSTCPKLIANVTIEQLCLDGGSIDQDDYKLTIEDDAFFYSGIINDGSLGNSLLDLTGNSAKIKFEGGTINSKVNADCDAIYLDGIVFNNEINLINNSSLNINCTGDNIFNAKSTIIHNGSGNWTLSSNSIYVDIFNDDAIFKCLGGGEFYVSDAGTGNTFNGSAHFEVDADGLLTVSNSSSCSNTSFNDDVVLKTTGGVLGSWSPPSTPVATILPEINIAMNSTGTTFNKEILFDASSIGAIKIGFDNQVTLSNTAYFTNTSSFATIGALVYLGNIVQNGNLAQKIECDQLTIYKNSIYNGPVEFKTNCLLEVEHSTFNSTAYLKNGVCASWTSDGGNIFNDYTIIEVDGEFRQKTNDNIFNSDVEFILPSAGLMEFYSGHNVYFRGNLKITGTGNVFLGDAIFDGYFPQKIENLTTGTLNYNGANSITMNKPSFDLTIDRNLSIANLADFSKGAIICTNGAVVEFLENTSIVNASNRSYVNGPCEVWNFNTITEFTFPTGKNRNYLPLKIIGQNTVMDGLGYRAEYFNQDQPLSTSPLSLFASYDNCEYFKLERVDAYSVDVEVQLSYNNSSCNINMNPGLLEVLHYDSDCGKWVSYGQSSSTAPIGSSPGTVTSDIVTNAPASPCDFTDYGIYVIGSPVSPANEPPFGFSWNIFGVYTTLEEDADLHVIGNVFVSKGNNGKSGYFFNDGAIHLSRDWMNVSKNRAFDIDGGGEVHFFGDYQRILGSDQELDVTQFHKVSTSGSGKKELFIDAWVDNSLALNDVEIACRDNILVINTYDATAISRTSGFISCEQKNGRLRRYLDGTDDYDYPLGSVRQTTRYRPLTISNSIGLKKNVVDAKMVNNNPYYDGYDPYIKLPHIIEVNDKFYHEINHITTNPVICDPNNPPNSNSIFPLCNPGGNIDPTELFDIKFYFHKGIDGDVQSIGHWDDNKAPNNFTSYNNSGLTTPLPTLTLPFWKSIGPVNSFNLSIAYPNLDFIQVDDWNDFSHEQFSLLKSGIIVGTGNFGNGPGGPVNWTSTGTGGTVNGSGNSNGTVVGTGTPGSGVSITVLGNNSNTGLGINIPVTGSGNVGGAPTTSGAGGSTQYPLDPDLYNSSGPTIVFNSVPPDYSLPDCDYDDIILNHGSTDPLKIQKTQTFSINTSLNVNDYSIKFLDMDDNVVPGYDFVPPSNPFPSNLNFNSPGPGLYKYELTVIGGPTFKGQFIVY